MVAADAPGEFNDLIDFAKTTDYSTSSDTPVTQHGDETSVDLNNKEMPDELPVDSDWDTLFDGAAPDSVADFFDYVTDELGLPSPGDELAVASRIVGQQVVVRAVLTALAVSATTMDLKARVSSTSVSASQVAVLAGTKVSDVIGKFTYTNGPDGTINPQQSWVDEYIRTEEVPILGRVTCHRVMLPQLRLAAAIARSRSQSKRSSPQCEAR